MKLVKASTGKSIIKISQKEWKAIGKKAGWLRTSQDELMPLSDDISSIRKEDGNPPTALDVFKKFKKGFIEARVEPLAREFDFLMLDKWKKEFPNRFDKYDEQSIQPIIDKCNNLVDNQYKYTL